MTIKEQVVEVLKNRGEMNVTELLDTLGVENRTYLEKVLRSLMEERKLVKHREGQKVYYSIDERVVVFEGDVNLLECHEDSMWREIQQYTDFVTNLSVQAEDIVQFAFTEILNNAIDHSKSGIAWVKVWIENDFVQFIIRDYGIGIFKSVMAKRHLGSETEAAQELMKGKLTTDPMRHSGEGIFWTSKIADRMSFRSFQTELHIDNEKQDYAIGKMDDSIFGTEVCFELNAQSEKSMHELFHGFSYNHDKTLLDTTKIYIKLYEDGETWISRSQAKKVLQGLEKFKKITFDFAGIDLIGQGFADEIFRVFQLAHPKIELEAINMGETVKLLVERAQNDPLGRDL